MANYITAQQFTEITGITAEQVEATGSETLFRDDRIAEAQGEFERDIQREFDGSEADYALVQRAVAFLTAHIFRLRKLELEPTTSADNQSVSPYLTEYRRLKNLIMQSRDVESTKPIFGGGFATLDTEDLDKSFRRNSFIEKR